MPAMNWYLLVDKFYMYMPVMNCYLYGSGACQFSYNFGRLCMPLPGALHTMHDHLNIIVGKFSYITCLNAYYPC
jgi:hypothetical protein